MPEDAKHGNYYRVDADPEGAFVRADFTPGSEAMKRGFELPSGDRRAFHRLSWRWRARTLPSGGDECVAERRDSAASVYVGWRRALRWYWLKYAWSSVGRKGALCQSQRTPFYASDTVILESGAPLGEWVTERVDLDQEFRHHFCGDARCDVPDLIGVAVLTDGDQTKSAAGADYGSFVLGDGH